MSEVVHKKKASDGKKTGSAKKVQSSGKRADGKTVVSSGKTAGVKKAGKSGKAFRRFVDVVLAVLLLCLVTLPVGRLHEQLGIAMAALLILHHLLNLGRTASFFRGRFTLYRFILTLVNLLMTAAVILTVYCGLWRSAYVLPDFDGFAWVGFSLKARAAFPWWAFALTGAHLGLHMAGITSRLSDRYLVRRLVNWGLALAAGTGLWLLIRNGITDCLFFRAEAAAAGTGQPLLIAFAVTLAEWFFFVWIGIRIARLILFNRTVKKK